MPRNKTCLSCLTRLPGNLAIKRNLSDIKAALPTLDESSMWKTKQHARAFKSLAAAEQRKYWKKEESRKRAEEREVARELARAAKVLKDAPKEKRVTRWAAVKLEAEQAELVKQAEPVKQESD